MRFYEKWLFPLLCRLEAEQAHEWTLALLSLAQRSPPGHFLLRQIAGRIPSRPTELFGLTFSNVLGVAAGFDKEARVAAGLGLLGFGHVEVGTLTPRRQSGNPRPRVFRLPGDRAIINRMGFPNGGIAAAVPHLRQLVQQSRPFVLGVSLGKQKETPLDEAAADYLAVMRAVYPYADYLAVNVSSPNTPGLRQLQAADYLEGLLGALVKENYMLAEQQAVLPRPLLLKVAPDLERAEVSEIVASALEHGISGVIATNTTLQRKGVSHPLRYEVGGLSGRPLFRRSLNIVALIQEESGGQLPVIGVGGVFTSADVRAMLAAGATLVQVYTGLVYEGPGMAGQILRQLADERRKETPGFAQSH